MQFRCSLLAASVLCCAASVSVLAQHGDAPAHFSAAESLGIRHVEFERLPKDLPPGGPRHVRMRKLLTLEPGEVLELTVLRLRAIGYLGLSNDSVQAGCGKPGTSVSHWAIRTSSARGNQEIDVPDGCVPADSSLDAKLSALRELGKVLWSKNTAWLRDMVDADHPGAHERPHSG